MLLFVVALAVAALAVFLPVGEWMMALLARVERLGAWAGVLLAALWIPVAILLVPGSLITLGTGFGCPLRSSAMPGLSTSTPSSAVAKRFE